LLVRSAVINNGGAGRKSKIGPSRRGTQCSSGPSFGKKKK